MVGYKKKPAVRSLATPFRMNEKKARKRNPEPVDGPFLTELDKIKLERRKRKDGRQREVQYQIHVAEMEAAKAGMHVVFVNHDNSAEGPSVRDIQMENFHVSVGGCELNVDCTVTLSHGRHYVAVAAYAGRYGIQDISRLDQLHLHLESSIKEGVQPQMMRREVAMILGRLL